MDIFGMIQAFALIVIAALLIMQFCNVFEPAAGYLGRNMSSGAKGSTIDAIGSSLPELMVTMMFLASGKPELILAGVAVTAGSAVFNAIVIPMMSIFWAKDKNGNKVSGFSLNKKVVLRDGFWLLLVEGVLIWFLGFSQFTLLMAGFLLSLYVMYVFHVMYDSKKNKEDKEEYEFESLESQGLFQTIINFDVNKALFKDKPFTTFSAWVVLGVAVVAIALACHLLAVGVEDFAVAAGVPVYFSAVVLGAAATSVPDTILSMKSASKGEYEDAVGNAVGSNIFDVTVALALPIAIYLGMNGGYLPMEQSSDLTMLRWFVMGTSTAVIISLFTQAHNITKKTAWFFLGLYATWIGYIVFSL